MELSYSLNGDHGFVGTAKLNMMTPVERLGLLKKSSVSIGQDGVVDTANLNLMDMLPLMYEIVCERVVECHFKYTPKVEDGSEEKPEAVSFKDIEELQYYGESTEVFMEIGMFLMQGPQLGKASKRTSKKLAK